MKILAIDIGAGTEDILLFDSEKNIENCVKMVLPAPSKVFAAKVKQFTDLRRDLFIKGNVIGGGAFSSALKKHIKEGLRVIMTENAAYTIRNSLDQVKELRIEILNEGNEPESFTGESLTLEEVNLEQLEVFLRQFNESLYDVDVVAIAVQDHGVFPDGMSNRRFRLQKMRELLEKNATPENLSFEKDEIPLCFLRMRSAAQASRKQQPTARVLLMDTSPDAILGCLESELLKKADPILAVNVGNGHTMAALVSKDNIIGMVEHHTILLNPKKIERLLIDFANGKITDQEVFEDNGHGVFFLRRPPGLSSIERIAATGPNRNILSRTDLDVDFVAPAGDVMMSGPVGLIRAAKKKFRL